MGCLGAVGTVAGAGLGYALAPVTGGLSIPLSMAAGAAIGGGIGSSIDASKAAGNAADAQVQSAQNATDAQLKMYFQSREDLAPWRTAGAAALNPLQAQAMTGPGDFNPEDQPGYKFGYQEFVEKPLLQEASAAGKLRSGNVLRALSDRAQGYASTQYDSWLNRWLSKMQPLQSLAGLGQTSASTTANAAVQTGQGIAQTTLAGGNALAGGYINKANALTGGVKTATGTLMDAAVLSSINGGNLFGNRYTGNTGMNNI